MCLRTCKQIVYYPHNSTPHTYAYTYIYISSWKSLHWRLTITHIFSPSLKPISVEHTLKSLRAQRQTNINFGFYLLWHNSGSTNVAHTRIYNMYMCQYISKLFIFVILYFTITSSTHILRRLSLIIMINYFWQRKRKWSNKLRQIHTQTSVTTKIFWMRSVQIAKFRQWTYFE